MHELLEVDTPSMSKACNETASGPESHMLDPENIKDAEEVRIKPVDVGIQTEVWTKTAHIQITPRTTSRGETCLIYILPFPPFEGFYVSPAVQANIVPNYVSIGIQCDLRPVISTPYFYFLL